MRCAWRRDHRDLGVGDTSSESESGFRRRTRSERRVGVTTIKDPLMCHTIPTPRFYCRTTSTSTDHILGPTRGKDFATATCQRTVEDHNQNPGRFQLLKSTQVPPLYLMIPRERIGKGHNPWEKVEGRLGLTSPTERRRRK